MNLAAHPDPHRPIDELLRLHAREAREALRDDQRTEVSAAALRTGVAGVQMGFVDDLDVNRFQRLAQARFDRFSHDPSRPPEMRVYGTVRLKAITLPTQVALLPVAVAAPPANGAVNFLLHIDVKPLRAT